MEVGHRDWVSQSPAIQRLGQFTRAHRQTWALGVPDFERFERELHEHVMAFEREGLGAELARYDVTAKEIEVAGVVYRPTLTSPETYLSAAGPVTVTRHLYRPAGRGSKSLCPLDLRAGIIAGSFTPRAARQAGFVIAHLTPGESEAVFAELEGMQPSRSALDRLPKVLSPHWESHRREWEAALRAQESVPPEAAVLALSVDGVRVPLKGGDHRAQRDQPGKHASGPTGNRPACSRQGSGLRDGRALRRARGTLADRALWAHAGAQEGHFAAPTRSGSGQYSGAPTGLAPGTPGRWGRRQLALAG